MRIEFHRKKKEEEYVRFFAEPEAFLKAIENNEFAADGVFFSLSKARQPEDYFIKL